MNFQNKYLFIHVKGCAKKWKQNKKRKRRIQYKTNCNANRHSIGKKVKTKRKYTKKQKETATEKQLEKDDEILRKITHTHKKKNRKKERIRTVVECNIKKELINGWTKKLKIFIMLSLTKRCFLCNEHNNKKLS